MQMVLRKVVLTMDCVKEGKKGTDSDGALPVELANDVTLSDGCESMAEFRKEETEDLIRNVGTSALANGGKWLLRMCAIHCGVLFCSCARKRAIQFGSRSAKMSNSMYFSSNRSARGDMPLPT